MIYIQRPYFIVIALNWSGYKFYFPVSLIQQAVIPGHPLLYSVEAKG
jgi:hypothetical protein